MTRMPHFSAMLSLLTTLLLIALASNPQPGNIHFGYIMVVIASIVLTSVTWANNAAERSGPLS